MTLSRPDFSLDKPNPNSVVITDAMWWLWLRLRELEPTSQLGGIYANKRGFHNTGNANLQNWPTNYSIRDEPNRTGPWWKTKASAIDWTFPEAQTGNYNRIAKYSKRLYDSGKDSSDPRLDLVMYQFFGQIDTDTTVEGWNEYRDENSSSDSSHLWHCHIEIFRNKCGDFDAMWALLTVLMGWTVQQWKLSITKKGHIDMFFLQVKGDQAVYVSDGINTRNMPAGTWETTCQPLINNHGVPMFPYNTLEDLIKAGGPLVKEEPPAKLELPEDYVVTGELKLSPKV